MYHIHLLLPLFHFSLVFCQPKRFYQKGNVTLGVLQALHIKDAEDQCVEMYTYSLGSTEAITFAIEKINNDPNLLPNVTLGFDIRDYCDSPVLAMKAATHFVKTNYLNKLIEEQKDKAAQLKSLKMNLTSPVSAVFGCADSTSSILVSSLLQVDGIPLISHAATSEELSSPYYDTFFRTIPPDSEQAKAMVDIIEYYRWRYIAAVAVDHSYGRYGLRALEREAYDRKTFCIAFSEYFTRSGYKGKIKAIVRKLREANNIKVVVLWSNFEPAKRFLKEANDQGLEGRAFLMSEGVAFVNPHVWGESAAIPLTPLVKASNRELSFLLMFAIALCFVLTMLHIAKPATTLCCILYPWRYFTNTACVSILFLKTNRLVRAFQTDIIPNWFKRYIVDRKRQFLVVLALNIVEVILTVLWLALDPPYQHQEIRPRTHVFNTCLPFRTTLGKVLRAVMFTYFIFLSLLCAIYAFKARRLPENFNETRYIGLAMYVLLISWAVYFPMDSSLEGFYTTIVACITALVTAYGLLLCVFAPKIFVILFHPEQNTNESMKAEIGQFTNVNMSSKVLNRMVRPAYTNETSLNGQA